jgi:hypothetical protein
MHLLLLDCPGIKARLLIHGDRSLDTENILPPSDFLTRFCRHSTTWVCCTGSAATWSAPPSATRPRCRSAPTSRRCRALVTGFEWLAEDAQCTTTDSCSDDAAAERLP